MAGGMLVIGRSASLSLLLVLVLLSGVSGCNNPELEEYVRPPVASKVTLTGSFLTESPDEILFPRKILFAIDSSLSMGDTELGYEVGSDPNYLRIEAVRNFIDKYNTNENVSFEVMLWSSSVFDATRTISGARGFTKDPEELNRVLDGASVDTTTDYLGTLSAIYQDIRTDILSSSGENLTRTKYIVVFLSDGMSNAQGKTQSEREIYDSVSEITAMVDENGVGGFNFHTSLLLGMLGAGKEESRAIAENVLQGMAERGKGQFTLFENAESIDFINVVDMRLTVEYQIKYLLAYNYNVRPGEETLHVDSDGDGLSDIEESDIYGTDPYMRDSDGDGLGDFFEVTLSGPGGGLDPLVSDSPCAAPLPGNVYPDTDADWMNNCEEDFKGTNRRVADTDHDGIPDGLEFLAGTNPLENQLTRDSDFDGVLDGIEVRQHTNVISNDPVVRRKHAYNYDIKDAGLVRLNQGDTLDKSFVRKYDFTISNIDILNTGGRSLPDGRILEEGENVIRLYIAQVPEDTPDVPPVFRMKEVTVKFAEVPDNRITLTPGDFSLLQ